MNVIPLLADNYKISNEGKTIEIKLRDSGKWHDQRGLTSYDVAFTLDTIKASNKEGIYGQIFETAFGAFHPYNIHNVIRVNIIDELNFEIIFDRSYSSNLESLTLPIIPKHIFEEEGIRGALELEKYNPIGTGPYKFEDYSDLTNVNLVKNEECWKGTLYINQIRGRVFRDEETILNAFKTGQISLATTLGFDWDKYKQNSRIRMIEYISQEYEFLGLNSNHNLFNGEEGIAIRKAINYGIDRQNIISKVYLGHAVEVDVPINPDSYLFSNAGHTYGYNENKAKQILKDAGFSHNQNEVLETSNGRELSFKLITNTDNTNRLQTDEAIIEDLKEVGIVVSMDTNENLFDMVERGNFDMVLLGGTISVIPDLLPMFHSSSIKNGTNFIKFKNKHMDEGLLKAYYSLSREEKIDTYDEVQQLLIGELPYISLFFKNRALLIDIR